MRTLDCGGAAVTLAPMVVLDGEQLDDDTPGVTTATGTTSTGDADILTVRWPGRARCRLTIRRSAPGRYLVAVDVIAERAGLLDAGGVRLRRQDSASRLLVDGFHSWDWAGVRDTGTAGVDWWGGLWGATGEPERTVAVSPLTGEVLALVRPGDGSLELRYVAAPDQALGRSGQPRPLGWRLGAGATAALGTLRIGAPHPHRAAGLPWIDRVTVTESGWAPRGWLSWNCVGATVTWDNVLEAARDLVPPDGVVLLDDGWMRRWGEWVENERFDRGLAELATAVAALDRRLGLWVAPLSVDVEADLARDRPELLLRDQDGEAVVDRRPARPQHVLDPRNADVRLLLHGLGQRLGRSGVAVLKADFLYQGTLAGRPGGVAPLRRAVGALCDGFRSRAGDAGPVWACGAPAPAVVGVVDACRSGGDAVQRVPSLGVPPPGPPSFVTGDAVVRAQERNLAARSWLWGPQLVCDVDAVSAGTISDDAPAVSDEVLDRWVRLVRRAGGPRLVSDRLERLDEGRAAQLRALLTAPAAPRERPVDPLAMAASNDDDFLAWQDGLPEEWAPV